MSELETRYRAKPVVPEVVEARQFTDEDPAAMEALADWCDAMTYTGGRHGHTDPPWQWHSCITPDVTIPGSKGHADPGDWIVRHAGGAYEVLSADEFAAKYESAGD